LISLLLLASSGCANHYAEPASRKGVAFLQATVPVWIVSIDGRRITNVNVTGVKHLRIPPGDHLVMVKYSSFEHQGLMMTAFAGSRNNLPVRFRAEPDHTYYLRDGRLNNRWKPYVTESLDPVFLDLPLH
jgi:hypothetical protein